VKNYDEFVADADDGLKAALSQTQFDAASNILNKKLKAGYDLTFLGELSTKRNSRFPSIASVARMATTSLRQARAPLKKATLDLCVHFW
jgi:hypothetical protein